MRRWIQRFAVSAFVALGSVLPRTSSAASPPPPLPAGAPHPWEVETEVDHRALLQGLNSAAFQRGEALYQSICINCHGSDGVTPQLSVAPAFGKGQLKYGVDPYAMFLTITKGNGLMAPQTWMTPAERYDVIHYIRQQLMKPLNPAYREVDAAYLAKLPRFVPPKTPVGVVERDFGPALASQLERRVVSALTIRLPEKTTVSYNLHNLDLAGAWQGGFLDLSETQHTQLRGEGEPVPQGPLLAGLQRWFWGHDGKLDYPREGLLPRGPLPEKWFHYHGHYFHGTKTLLSYSIDERDILELPDKQSGAVALVNTLQIGPGGKPLVLCVGEYQGFDENLAGLMFQDSPTVTLTNATGAVRGQIALVAADQDGKPGEFVAAAVLGDSEGMTWQLPGRYRLVLRIPASQRAQTIQVVRYFGRGEVQVQFFAGLVRHRALKEKVPDLATLIHGGPLRWPQVLTTQGTLGTNALPYTLDTLTLPESTPWHTWFRTAALDFLSDGRLVLSTHGGDLWIVSGIDRELKALKWKRFAAGLYEPFGVKVVADRVYVTCKDRLVRLHDFNGDGEADFYESFSADPDVSVFFHAYNFDLQTDSRGYFYYVKAGQYTDHALPGALIQVSRDGKRREVYCTGFRTPNGMGMLPGDRPVVSDNQGNWMPASKISLVKPGGYYGYVQTHQGRSRTGTLWAPDGGRIDAKKVVPPATFDQPIIWMPQEFDNSSGGQLWVDDPRWGPLSGHLLHTSFGKGWLYYLMLQDVGDVSQAAIIRLPLDFMTGIHRARVNPADGQVYATGLNGWNANGRPGLLEGGVQRVRYTGKPVNLVMDVKAVKDGLRLAFNFPLRRDSATSLGSYDLEQWNYKWQATYGSEQWSLKHPDEKGHDKLVIQEVELGGDGRSVRLKIPGLRPVNQILLKLNLKTARDAEFREEVYLTINQVPGR